MGVGDKKKMIIYEQPELIELNAMKHEFDLFIKAVLNDENPVVSGYDGLEALKTAEIIIKKIEESRIA
jgi:predicted dehydrogenase